MDDMQRNEEIARCLFRESNDPLFVFDPVTHRVLDVNPAAQRLTGFDKDHVQTLLIWDLFRGPGRIGLDPVIDAYRRTGFFHSREGFWLSRERGEPIPVNISVSRIHTQPSPLGLIVARDITERKRAERALEESERRYRALVETARVIFWTLSDEGQITSVNPLFRAVAGWDAAECLGRPLADFVHPGDRDSLQDLLGRARGGEATPVAESRILAKGGGTRILEFLSIARFDEGRSACLSVMARDVTELRRAAEALQRTEALERAKHAAEEADRAKTDFLANVSHEIRTPMTAILGFLEILLNDDHVRRLPQERLADLLIIKQNGVHLLDIINDILELSEIEAGKLKVEPRPCSPAGIAAEVAATMRVRADAKGLALAVEFPGPVPAEIRTDPGRLRQILTNLVGNAVKYTERGSVTIRVRIVDAGGGDADLRFEVADTGRGLSGAQLAHLFEPFSHAADRASEGSGLGLAISRRLASLLGGRIDVDSAEGRGSTFTVHLPVGPADLDLRRPAPPRLVASSLPPRHEAADGPLSCSILLAEDNPAIQRVTALYLEKMGATVVVAGNGQEAIDLVQAARDAGRLFDVILMDMQMPVLDGYEATRRIRGDGYQGAIFALTAYAMASDRQECLDIGCDEHLSKPIDWDRLRSLISESLTENR